MDSPHKSLWIESLKRAYMLAVRSGDNVAGAGRVLECVGLSPQEIEELAVLARIDDTDYVPDLERTEGMLTEDALEPEPDDIDDCHSAKTGNLRIPKPSSKQ